MALGTREEIIQDEIDKQRLADRIQKALGKSKALEIGEDIRNNAELTRLADSEFVNDSNRGPKFVEDEIPQTPAELESKANELPVTQKINQDDIKIEGEFEPKTGLSLDDKLMKYIQDDDFEKASQLLQFQAGLEEYANLRRPDSSAEAAHLDMLYGPRGQHSFQKSEPVQREKKDPIEPIKQAVDRLTAHSVNDKRLKLEIGRYNARLEQLKNELAIQGEQIRGKDKANYVSLLASKAKLVGDRYRELIDLEGVDPQELAAAKADYDRTIKELSDAQKSLRPF